jgi:hypothetical protein
MLRRAYGQHRSREIAKATNRATSQIISQQLAPVLQAMTVEFARKSRSAGKRPIILLLQDKGYEQVLFDVLKNTMSEHNIDFISTHDITPSTDSSNFLSDGHFTNAANIRIASKLQVLICRNAICRQAQTSPS